MNFLKNLLAGAAAVATYKLVDYGLRRLERDVLHHDVPLEPELPKAEKDAIVVAGSRLDRIPTARQRDAIARGLNLVGSVLTTALVLEVRQLFTPNQKDDEYEAGWLRNLAFAAGGFILTDFVVKRVLGLAESTGRRRRFVSHMAAKGTQNAVRKALA